MRLKTIKLTNFRGYREPIKIEIAQDMTGFIGRNDFGKSTILEAMAIFFESDDVKPDKDDMNCFGRSNGESHFAISCEFDDLPEDIIIDERFKTTLEAEHLLNSDKNLEIKKTFKATTGKLDKVYVRCLHPENEELKKLLSMKLADLKKEGQNKNIADTVEDKRVASLWRKAIREAASPYPLNDFLLDVDNELEADVKSIWKKIYAQLPTFALFKADRESSDKDSEAKNPLQQAVKNAQEDMREKISEIEEEIKKNVLDVAERTLAKLSEMTPELANKLTPCFKENPRWTFNFILEGENGIPINKRGSGVRRLILLNFFRAEAERIGDETSRNVIYAIEEPETSQHPDYQVMLMNALLSLANRTNNQIIITTHVPALAGLIPLGGVRYVTKDENNRPIIKMSGKDTLFKRSSDSDTLLEEVAESLGMLTEIGMEKARGIVLVEGNSDVIFLEHADKCLKESGDLSKSLEEKNIVPIPIGGCKSLRYWLKIKLADNLKLPCCVFLDSDKGANNGQPETIKQLQKEAKSDGKEIFVTRKREIENYLCPELIDKYKKDKKAKISFKDEDDAKKIIASATGIRETHVISTFWREMTADKIKDCSAYKDTKGTRKIEIVEIIEGIISAIENSSQPMPDENA